MKYVNTKPLAILLAAYNCEKFLAEQLDSVLSQTNQEWTLYIRNDGSTDHTADIIKQYAAKYNCIQPIDVGGGNLGCRGNFFRLLEVVESQYYMFCDADDVWNPDMIELCLTTLRNNEKENRPILVHSNYTVVDRNLSVKIPDMWKYLKLHPEKYYNYNLIAIANPIAGNIMFNHILKNYLFPLANNTLLHDRWIPMVAARHNAIFKPVYTPTKKYRQHSDNYYGVRETQGKNVIQKLCNVYKANKFVADKLVQAGYGSYAKYIWYKLIYIIKRNLF